jgi:hypothetical protein
MGPARGGSRSTGQGVHGGPCSWDPAERIRSDAERNLQQRWPGGSGGAPARGGMRPPAGIIRDRMDGVDDGRRQRALGRRRVDEQRLAGKVVAGLTGDERRAVSGGVLVASGGGRRHGGSVLRHADPIAGNSGERRSREGQHDQQSCETCHARYFSTAWRAPEWLPPRRRQRGGVPRPINKSRARRCVRRLTSGAWRPTGSVGAPTDDVDRRISHVRVPPSGGRHRSERNIVQAGACAGRRAPCRGRRVACARRRAACAGGSARFACHPAARAAVMNEMSCTLPRAQVDELRVQADGSRCGANGWRVQADQRGVRAIRRREPPLRTKYGARWCVRPRDGYEQRRLWHVVPPRCAPAGSVRIFVCGA